MLIPNLSDVKEPQPVEPGEYDLFIKTVKEVVVSTGRTMLFIDHEIIGEDNAAILSHSISVPMASDPKSNSDKMWLIMKRYVRGIGFDPDQENDPADFEGTTFLAKVGKKFSEYDGCDINTILGYPVS